MMYVKSERVLVGVHDSKRPICKENVVVVASAFIYFQDFLIFNEQNEQNEWPPRI